MPKKRPNPIYALLLAAAFAFCGCGASGSDTVAAVASSAAPAAAAPYVSNQMSKTEAPRFEPAEAEADVAYEDAAEEAGYVVSSAAGGMAGPQAPDDRKIVKHSNMELETKDFDAAIAQILDSITKSGGYIESQSISGQSIRYNDDYYERSADINARIPSARLAEVTSAIGGICNVTSHWEGIDDITDRYFDTDARLKSLQLQEERLLEILSKAESLEDVITLEAKLSDVRYEIESLTASIRRMDSQVSFSYLNMHLREVVEYQQVTTAPKSFGERISDAFTRSGNKLESFFEGAVIFMIEDFPLMLIHIVIFAAIIVIAFKLLKWLTLRFGAGAVKQNRFAGRFKKDPAPESEKQSEDK